MSFLQYFFNSIFIKVLLRFNYEKDIIPITKELTTKRKEKGINYGQMAKIDRYEQTVMGFWRQNSNMALGLSAGLLWLRPKEAQVEGRRRREKVQDFPPHLLSA